MTSEYDEKLRKQYPLYPMLPEAGGEEAQKLIDGFKKLLVKAAEEALGDLYCGLIPHIESDSWANYRNEMMDGFRNCDNRLIQGEYDFKEIRQQILKHHRKDIINDLNQDLLEENKKLKEDVERLRNEMLERRY